MSNQKHNLLKKLAYTATIITFATAGIFVSCKTDQSDKNSDETTRTKKHYKIAKIELTPENPNYLAYKIDSAFLYGADSVEIIATPNWDNLNQDWHTTIMQWTHDAIAKILESDNIYRITGLGIINPPETTDSLTKSSAKTYNKKFDPATFRKLGIQYIPGYVQPWDKTK